MPRSLCSWTEGVASNIKTHSDTPESRVSGHKTFHAAGSSSIRVACNMIEVLPFRAGLKFRVFSGALPLFLRSYRWMTFGMVGLGVIVTWFLVANPRH